VQVSARDFWGLALLFVAVISVGAFCVQMVDTFNPVEESSER